MDQCASRAYKRWQLSDIAASDDEMGTPTPGQLRGQFKVLEEIEEAKMRLGKGPLLD